MRQENAKPIILVVAAALIDPDGRVLIAKRPPDKAMAGLWEFPGGKIEAGETPEQALIRELDEELAITVQEPCLAPFTFASHSYDKFHLLMPLLSVPSLGGNSHSPRTYEHQMGPAARTHRRSACLSDAGGRFAAAADAARSVVTAFAADNRGATAIEYALIARTDFDHHRRRGDQCRQRGEHALQPRRRWV